LSDYEPVEVASLEETTELIEYFKKQVDREALRENLKLTPAQRVEKMQRLSQKQCPDRTRPDIAHDSVRPMREPAAPYSTDQTGEDRSVDATNDLVEAFKKDVDRTLLIENLKLTVAERMEKFEANMKMIYELRRAGQRMRERQQGDK
jgi:hypothetical protein